MKTNQTRSNHYCASKKEGSTKMEKETSKIQWITNSPIQHLSEKDQKYFVKKEVERHIDCSVIDSKLVVYDSHNCISSFEVIVILNDENHEN